MAQYYRGLPAWKDARPIFFRVLIMLGDVAVVALSYSFGYWMRFNFDPFLTVLPVTKGIPEFAEYLLAFPVIQFMWVLSLSWNDCYQRVSMPALDDAIRIIRSSFLGTVLAMSAMFLYRDISYSRVVFVIGGVVSCVSLVLWREILKNGYLNWIRATRRPYRVMIIGSGRLSITLRKILKKVGDRAVLRQSVQDFEALKKTIGRSRINEVLVANPEIDHKLAVRLAAFCEEKNVKFRILPDILEIRMGEVVIDESLGIPTIELKSISLHGTAFLAKRVLDVTAACLLLGICFIPLMIISILIKMTSRGPILYHHKRMGFRGREFEFMKFRTMVVNADDLLEDLKAKSDRGGPVFKMKDDPRITKIGKFLRRYSLDEVPQLLNVLRGEMSLVGPRPQVIWEAKQYDDWAKKRLNVLPGITGLWQVSGRAELTYQEMIDLDIYYIEHWSPGMDIRIIAKTLPAVLFGDGAY